jgi:hypothetical protein
MVKAVFGYTVTEYPVTISAISPNLQPAPCRASGRGASMGLLMVTTATLVYLGRGRQRLAT